MKRKRVKRLRLKEKEELKELLLADTGRLADSGIVVNAKKKLTSDRQQDKIGRAIELINRI